MAQIDQIQTDIDRLLIDVDRLKNSNTNPESVIKEYIPDISDLNVLNNDLDTLNGSLDDLAMDLYGDESHEGLVDYLNTLQVQLYGKGQTYTKDGVVHNCTITDPCPDSLKGRLNTLRTNLDDLSLANAELKKSLKALTDDLTNFTGTFAQFKQSLEAQGIHYDSLDASIQSLLHSVYNTFQAIDVVDGRVDDVNDTLGDPADTTNTSVFGKINNTNVAVDNVSNQADKVEGRMYAGWDESTGTKGSGTITQPANGTVKKNLDVAQNDIVEVRGVANDADGKADVLRADVGIVKPDNDGSLQQQITYLPAYISRLYVTNSRNTDDDLYEHDDKNCATLLLNSNNSFIVLRKSELTNKSIRDGIPLTFNIYITSPSNVVTVETKNVDPYNFWDVTSKEFYVRHRFVESGLHIISCEHLKCAVMVSDPKPQWTYSNSQAVDSNNGIRISRLNNVIVIEGIGIINNSIASNSYLDVGTVSPPPSHMVYSHWTGTSGYGYMRIDTQGNVRLYNIAGTIPASNRFIINCTYTILSSVNFKLSDVNSNKPVTQTGESSTISAKLTYNDGTPVQGETINFYYDDGT